MVNVGAIHICPVNLPLHRPTKKASGDIRESSALDVPAGPYTESGITRRVFHRAVGVRSHCLSPRSTDEKRKIDKRTRTFPYQRSVLDSESNQSPRVRFVGSAGTLLQRPVENDPSSGSHGPAVIDQPGGGQRDRRHFDIKFPIIIKAKRGVEGAIAQTDLNPVLVGMQTITRGGRTARKWNTSGVRRRHRGRAC